MAILDNNKILYEENDYENSKKFEELFVIQPNSSIKEILTYSIYKNIEFLEITFTNNSFTLNEYTKVIKTPELKSLEKYISNIFKIDKKYNYSGIEKYSLKFLKKYFDIDKKNVKDEKKLFEIFTRVEKSKILPNDIIIWMDSRHSINYKKVPDNLQQKNRPIFIIGEKKFILRSRDTEKAEILFGHLVKTKKLISQQLEKYSHLKLEILKKMKIPLSSELLIDFAIAGKSLEPGIEEIYNNIKKNLMLEYKYKELVRKETNYIIHIFFIEAEDKKLIEIYDKSFDLLNREIEKVRMNSEEKKLLKSILTLDVVPYESKLYE